MSLKPEEIGLALVCAVFAIAFLQSGVDKIVDRKGNLEWLTGHFASSPLKGGVPFLLSLLTILELASGTFAAISVVASFMPTSKWLVVVALSACGLTLVSLFFGQRFAKDYPGAASLTGYFAVLFLGFVFAR